MEVVESSVGAIVIIAPKGALCADDAKALRESFFTAISAHRGRVVLDLNAVPFVDSAGLESLLDLSDALSDCGRSLKLVAVGPTVREAIELVGLGTRFEQFSDVNAAARSFL